MAKQEHTSHPASGDLTASGAGLPRASHGAPGRALRSQALLDAPQVGMPVVVVALADLEQMLRATVRAELDADRSTPVAEWLDAKGIAVILGVHPRSVQKMARFQGLPAHKLGPKLLRYRRDEVERWVRDRPRRGRTA